MFISLFTCQSHTIRILFLPLNAPKSWNLTKKFNKIFICQTMSFAGTWNPLDQSVLFFIEVEINSRCWFWCRLVQNLSLNSSVPCPSFFSHFEHSFSWQTALLSRSFPLQYSLNFYKKIEKMKRFILMMLCACLAVAFEIDVWVKIEGSTYFFCQFQMIFTCTDRLPAIQLWYAPFSMVNCECQEKSSWFK